MAYKYYCSLSSSVVSFQSTLLNDWVVIQSFLFIALFLKSTKIQKKNIYSRVTEACNIEIHTNREEMCFKNCNKFTLLVLLLVVANPSEGCTSLKRESRIQLDKNGYTNIVIGIEDSVRENVQLIERIKETFTEASHLLFNMTK